MDFKAKQTNPNPREKASTLGKLFFWWIIPLFRKGLKKDLNVNDLYDVPSEDVSHNLGVRLGK